MTSVVELAMVAAPYLLSKPQSTVGRSQGLSGHVLAHVGVERRPGEIGNQTRIDAWRQGAQFCRVGGQS